MMPDKAKKPVMDVEKPGATPASATSRPLIVSRGPAIKDPMVNEDEAQPATEPQLVSSSKKKTIQPLSEQETKPAEGASPEPSPDTKEASQEQSAPEATPIDETPEVTSNAAAPAMSDEDIKRQELVDKLVLEKKYFVPIGAVQKKRTVRATVLFLALLLSLAAGAVVAVDANLISIGIHLPFDLIK
jgi:hypothetical protein